MKGDKNPIKTDGWNHYTEDKRGGQRNAKRRAAHKKNQRRERASPSCGRKCFLQHLVTKVKLHTNSVEVPSTTES